MEAVYVAAKTNKSPLRPKESTETKMLFQCDVMLMIASPKEDNFRFSLLVTLQSKRSIIYLLERIGEMLRAIFVGLFNDTFTTKLMITLMIIPQTTAAIQSQPSGCNKYPARPPISRPIGTPILHKIFLS